MYAVTTGVHICIIILCCDQRLVLHSSLHMHNYAVTTGLQSVTSTLRNEIVCEFLPGSVADGCLLEWRPMSQDGETGCTVASRQDNRAIVELPSLLPGTTYEVEGYGRQGNTTLHIFPITLDGGLDIPGKRIAMSSCRCAFRYRIAGYF